MAELDESGPARSIFERLPMESTISRWGDEIFFNIDIKTVLEKTTLDVNVGDVAFWPQGKCLCVFFGRTPQSTSEKPVPANPVVIVGKTLVFPDELKDIQSGEKITLSAADETTVVLKETPPEDNRKLSQAEIDILVKKLLAQRNKAVP